MIPLRMAVPASYRKNTQKTTCRHAVASLDLFDLNLKTDSNLFCLRMLTRGRKPKGALNFAFIMCRAHPEITWQLFQCLDFR